MWAGRLASGSQNPITRAELREVCANWVEFTIQVTALWGGNTQGENERTEHFLWNVYLGAYGAAPSQAQMQPHIDALNLASAIGEDAVITKAREIARTQLEGSAYANRNRTDREYVQDLYEVFWQRVPDQSGWDHWTREVNLRGRESVLLRFSTSTAFKEVASTLYREMLWLVADHLDTPRMIAERTGSLSGIRRHDYLPFGEEIGVDIGGRTAAQGYVVDTVSQKFTGKIRDGETGLDYFLARYYSSAQGRFTSPDPIIISDKQIVSPQTWNLYNYAGNNPLAYTDPTGMERVRLGQHTDEEINMRRKEIDQQIKQGKKAGTLTKEQKKQLEAEKKTLGLEKEGNRLVSNLLARLPANERQGLQVSDFTLSTDVTGTDFMSDPTFVEGAGGTEAAQALADAAGTKSMFLVRGYSKEIFINTAQSNIKDMMRGDRDWITYGATLVKHEQSHRDYYFNEFQAYTEQKRVLEQFGPGAFSSREVYQFHADFINQELKRYKPKP